MTVDQAIMDRETMRQLLVEELPYVLREYPSIRYSVIGIVAETFAKQSDIQSILEHLTFLREDFNRRMEGFAQRLDEQREDYNRRMEEFAKRQDEFARRLDAFAQRLDEQREDYNRRMEEFAKRQDEFARRLDEQREDYNRRMEEFAKRQDEFARRLDEQREDYNRRMEEFAKRQDEFARRLDEQREDYNRRMEEFAQRQDRHERWLESQIGALGARWGIMAEESFRNGLTGILDDRFGMQVERFWQVDTSGRVFGHPDQVEIDVVVHDGEHWLLELKSSMSRGDVYLFERKVAFYEELKSVQAARKIIISPMVERGAEEVARSLGIEVYTSAYDLEIQRR